MQKKILIENEMTLPALETVTLNELYENVYKGKQEIISGLLCGGAYLFAGAPKLGKSFLMAQFAYHISTGIPLWGFDVKQGTVLYLALEDDHRRLQERLYRMYGENGTDKLRFAVRAKQLEMGLEVQLKAFVHQYPDTKLIIIDTLQKIREMGNEKVSYAKDYEVIGKLKEFADLYNICLLLVHHTRKQQSDDKFDMISGTNGLLGSSDGAFILHKKDRVADKAELEISGRDQQEQKLYLRKNREKLTWELEKIENEPWIEKVNPNIELISRLVTIERPEWQGTPTELVKAIDVDLKPNTLSTILNVNAGKMAELYGIDYEKGRKHTGRYIKLKRTDS